MPFDARPSAEADLVGFMTPRDAAGLTPVGTLREPVFAAVIEAIRTLTETAPPR